ncbi:MAG: pilus assembly protein PilM [Candidatus Brocadiaceae bacterium]|jgi:type IV pilus assembly protein PilM
MAKTIWGMDFGAWSLKVVRGRFEKKPGTITVDLMEEFRYGDLPCGYDASPRDKHRESIEAFRSRHEVRPGDALCVSVTGSEVFSRFINLPPSLERIGEIVRYEARQQIPFDIDDVIWDWQPVKSEPEIAEGEEIEVGLFALKNERAEDLLEVLAPWRSNLQVIQNAPLAIYNLLEYEGMVEEPMIVLDVGASTTDVLVLNPPRFWTRSLLVAGNDLTNALVEKFGVSLEEAEQIKQRVGRSRHREQIMNILEPVFDEIGNEIQRSLGYYKSLVREVRFDRIVLLGNALRMAGTRQMVAKRLQYQVQSFRELRRLKLDGALQGEDLENTLPGFAAALGLLVQGAGQSRLRINMVPEEVAFAGALAQKKPWILAAAVGLLLLAVLLLLGESLYAREVKEIAEGGKGIDWKLVERLQNLESQYKSAQEAVRQVQRSDLALLARQEVDSDRYLDILAALARTLPRDVYLMRLGFRWSEADKVEDTVVNMASASWRTGRARAPRRGSGLAGIMGPPEFVRGRGAPGGERGGRRQRETEGATGAFQGPVKPQVGENAKLVMFVSAESRVIRQGENFIRTNVVDALKDARLPDSGRQAFEKVGLVGDLQDVWRDAATGERVPEAGVGAEHFVAFRAYGVVNTGSEGEKAE